MNYFPCVHAWQPRVWVDVLLRGLLNNAFLLKWGTVLLDLYSICQRLRASWYLVRFAWRLANASDYYLFFLLGVITCDGNITEKRVILCAFIACRCQDCVLWDSRVELTGVFHAGLNPSYLFQLRRQISCHPHLWIPSCTRQLSIRALI